MPDPNWLESRKKRSLYYYLVIPSIVVAAGFLFFYNNREVFFKKPQHRQAMPDVRLAPITTASISDTSAALKQCRGKAAPAGKGSVASNRGNQTPAKASDAAYETVLLENIPCMLRGREAVKVALSVELRVASGPFKKEALLKRENLRVMVQKVFAEKTVDELIVDSLRIQTKAAMDRIVERGTIIDVQFRNFRIEKVQ